MRSSTVLAFVVLVQDTRSDPAPYFRPASLTDLETTADVQIQQTFAFDDSEKQFISTVRDGEDPTHDWGSYSDVDLARWLERPILAGTYIWEVGQPFPQIYFNPWSAFLDSPSVAQKISNFYLLRCKMHMKVMVNGSQMHYGRGFVSYRPLLTEPGERFQFDSADPTKPFGTMDYDSLNSFSMTAGEEVCIMTQSQWPKIFIDPGQSMGGEMEFPFFYGANWFRIPNRDWVANPSAVDTGQTMGALGDPVANLTTGTAPNVSQGPYGARVSHMGVIHSSSLASLKHANNATDPVTIQVFLWASDVKFSIPTAVGHPAVSIPPVLESSAKPQFIPQMRTEYVPNFLGDLAKSNSDDIVGRLEVGDSCLATSEATVGLGPSNEMSISALAQRECWLDRFVWGVDTPAETPIWTARVTPQYFKRQRAVGTDRVSGIPCVQPTPCAYAALPFGYWRGSMKYRIQIVASNLHRGRLRIVYDPVADVHARSNVNDYPESQMNEQYSRTIDIAGESGRDFCFEVGYMQEKPYLSLLPLEGRDTQGSGFNFDWINYGVDVPTPTTNRVAPTPSTNGQISIYVLNRLAVPNTDINNDVTINVFVSAGQDMDFQMPTSKALNAMSFVGPTGFPVNWSNTDPVPQAVGNESLRRRNVFGVTKKLQPPERVRAKGKTRKEVEFSPQMETTTESAAMGATEMEDVPQDPPTKAWMGDCSQAPTMSSVTFGEKMDSWHQLMNRWQIYKRETYTERNDIPGVGLLRGDEGYTVINIEPNFPPFPGPAPMSSLWSRNTGVRAGVSGDPTQGPFICTPVPPGTSQPLAMNYVFNWAPAAKYSLMAPIESEPTQEFPVDTAELLKVNPGQLTMMHFVTRMFIGRKGAIMNKYILDGNKTSSNVQGTKIMSVKRLPDSGVLSGNSWLGNVDSAQDAEETNLSRVAFPAYGGFWSHASCRISNATSRSIAGVNGVSPLTEAQALNGSIQSGASQIVPPNWFDPLVYPSRGDYTNITFLDDPMIKSDLMMTNTFDGTHVTTSRQQPVIEVEIPFYVNSRFIKNDLILNNTRGVQAHAVKYESVRNYANVDELTDERGTVTYIERHVRPGKDFALFYLANVPHICLLSHFIYNTITGSRSNGAEPLEVTDAAYGALRYWSACRQSESAYKPDVDPNFPASFSINSYPNDTYFYEQTIEAQVYPSAQFAATT